MLALQMMQTRRRRGGGGGGNAPIDNRKSNVITVGVITFLDSAAPSIVMSILYSMDVQNYVMLSNLDD